MREITFKEYEEMKKNFFKADDEVKEKIYNNNEYGEWLKVQWGKKDTWYEQYRNDGIIEIWSNKFPSVKMKR